MIRWVIRIGMTAADRLRRVGWRLSKRPMRGVRGIVLTAEGRVVLVRHSYTNGWYLPSGGVKRGEMPEDAIRRELAEEIGLRSGDVSQVGQSGDLLGRRPHQLTTFIVRDAVYRPRWNLEIEEVAAFALDALPDDVSPGSRRAIAAHVR